MAGRVAAGSGAKDPSRNRNLGKSKGKLKNKKFGPGLGPNGGRAQSTDTSGGQSNPNGTRGGRGGRSSGGRYYGAVGGYQGVDIREAMALAQSMINPDLRALRGDKRKLRRETRHAAQDVNDLYGRSVGDVNAVYDKTGKFIADQNAAIGQTWAGAQNTAQAAQSALAAQLASNGSNNMAGADSELARLGIQGSGNLGALQSDQDFAVDAASITGANNMANLQAMGSNATSIGNLLGGMNAGERGSRLGQLLTGRNEQLGDIQDARLDGFSEVRNAMKDVRAGRKDLMLQLMQQLQQTGWSQYMDQQNLQMQRRAMRGGGGGGGYGSSSIGSSSGGTSGGSGYYGGKVDALINALSGGSGGGQTRGPRGVLANPDRPQHMAHIPNKKKKRPYSPGTTLSGI